MLYKDEEIVTRVPHSQEFNDWKSSMTKDEYQLCRKELINRIGNRNYFNSSWIGADAWAGTALEEYVYLKACKGDQSDSGFFMGLIIWEILMEDPHQEWEFYRYEEDKENCRGLTYYKIDTSAANRKRGKSLGLMFEALKNVRIPA